MSFRLLFIFAAAVSAIGLLAGSATPAEAASTGPAHVYGWGKSTGGPGGSANQLRVRRSPAAVHGIEGTVTQISTSNSDSYALTSSGTVYAWGAASEGELGNGQSTATYRAVKVDFPSGVRITSLPNPMPYDGGLALASNGAVYGWGDDTYHQLCMDSTSQAGHGKYRYVAKPTRIPVKDVTFAAGAARHTLFDSADTLEGCGWNKNGDLGDDKTAGQENHPTPVKGLPPGKTVKAVTAAWGNEGVLYTDGSFYDWGFGQAGQIGNGTTANALTAQRVALPAPAAQVSEGGSVASNGTTLAILSNGSTVAWGNGSHGQIGNGSASDALRPTAVKVPSGVRFTQVNSGGATCYGIGKDGSLYAWGTNKQGQLGIGKSPSQVPQETSPVSVGLHLTQVSSTASNVAGYARSSKT